MPAIGSCIDSGDTAPIVVPCSELHTGEVLESWASGAQPAASDPDQPGGACIIGFRQITPRGSGWAPPPYEIRLVDVVAGGSAGWGACVQEPDPAWGAPDTRVRYTGRLLGKEPVTAFPPQLRACFLAPPQGEPATPKQIACGDPHDWEVLAVTGPVGPVALKCGAFARSIVGSDAVFAGETALTVGTMPGGYGSTAVVTSDPALDEMAVVYVNPGVANCAIRAPTGTQLVGSVVGLGNKPLPFG